jgi:hypothetical protein
MFVSARGSRGISAAFRFLRSMLETFRRRDRCFAARLRAYARAREQDFTRLIRVARLTPSALLFMGFCAACSAPQGAASASSTARATAPAGGASATVSEQLAPLDLTSSGAWPEPYRSDPLWTRAARGDALDRHTLAEREGAHGLMTALALGGDLGRTALAALPDAPDRRDASAELCRLIASAQAPTRHWLLAALHELLMPRAVTGPEPEPEPEPDADAGCRALLLALARDTTLDASEQDLAVSARAYLEPATSSAR